MLAFKDGVRLNLQSGAIRHLLDTLAKVATSSLGRQALAYDDITITSGNDGQHSQHSKHYRDEAIDIRTHNLKPAMRERFRAYYESALNATTPGHWRVLHEQVGSANEHLHAQVAKGRTFTGDTTHGPTQVLTRHRDVHPMGDVHPGGHLDPTGGSHL